MLRQSLLMDRMLIVTLEPAISPGVQNSFAVDRQLMFGELRDLDLAGCRCSGFPEHPSVEIGRSVVSLLVPDPSAVHPSL